jgi:hypothetical protein
MSPRNIIAGMLCLAATLCACHQETKVKPTDPIAVRVATVEVAETSSETLRYSASIIPNAQVDLSFRSSGYVTNVAQVRGADGRLRDVGAGDYALPDLVLAHIRREDVQNELAEARAQHSKITLSGKRRWKREGQVTNWLFPAPCGCLR